MEPRPWHAAYDPGVPTSIDYRRTTLPEMLRQSARRNPDGVALRFMNRTLTYRELDTAVDRFAAALRAADAAPGTRVGIQLPNLPQTVIAFYGTLRAGAVAVMTNPLYTGPEIEHQWKDAGCTVCVTMDFLFQRTVRGLLSRLPVRRTIVASIPEYLRLPLRLLAPLKLRREGLVAPVPREEGVQRFRAFLDSAEPDAPAGDAGPVSGLDDLAALQYTGGTTGVAKGAMLSHGNLSMQTQQIRAWLPELVQDREVFLAALPFFHVFGLTVAMSLPVVIGAEMVVMPNPRDWGRLIHAINRHRTTIFPVVPAMVHGINGHPKARTLDVRSLKMCVSGSAPMPEDTLRRFEKLTGGRIVEGYGLTEASPVTHINPNRGRRKVSTIGVPVPDTDCKIVSMDDEVTPLGPDEEGELLVRGPQVMQGYWNRPDESREALRGGWLHTGDLAAMDEDGYFRIVGRLKDLIVCSGYNVYPDEVDRVLADHPAVLECATIGVPDSKRGETVKSFVVLAPGRSATVEELTEHCRERLAPYKIPRAIAFRESLPKSSVLKILRRRLLEEELADGG
jgi:long-chain acyl-CoA synthetase